MAKNQDTKTAVSCSAFQPVSDQERTQTLLAHADLVTTAKGMVSEQRAELDTTWSQFVAEKNGTTFTDFAIKDQGK